MIKKVGIIGGGAWGTALGVVAKQAGREVVICSRNEQVVKDINQHQVNSVYLKDIKLPSNLRATSNINDALNNDLLIITTPSQYFRTTCKQIRDSNKPPTPIIICTKGIEQNTNMLMSEIVKEILPTHSVAILSGPNFAHEVAKGLPTGATIASTNQELAEKINLALSSFYFRLYYSDDILSTQIVGAMKNVLAIGCGIVIGKQLGENAKAVIITRGLAEIGRLCVAKGGKIETLLSLAGIGDVVLTCSSPTSRNTSFGLSLCQGKTLHDIMATNNTTVEGALTTKSVIELAEKLAVDLPICTAIYKVLYEQQNIDAAIKELLSRTSSYKS
jgi:glycerol-3-phosphate dehydrogenase (NAD(P)+)